MYRSSSGAGLAHLPHSRVHLPLEEIGDITLPPQFQGSSSTSPVPHHYSNQPLDEYTTHLPDYTSRHSSTSTSTTIMATRHRYQRLDARQMCSVEPAELASYLRKHLLEAPDTEIISSNLLQSIALEAIPPRIYRVWLSVCPDANAIAAGLRQTHSVSCRVSALKEFTRRFRTEKVTQVWQALGWATEIVEMMSKWSVNEVKAFCRAVRLSGTALMGRQERQLLVDELMSVLIPDGEEPSEVRNPDSRPLLVYYAQMVSACTSAFIQRWRDQGRQPALQMRRLLQTQPLLCKQWCLDLVREGNPDIGEYLPVLESAMLQPSRDDHSVTESMSFAVEVLEVALANGCFPMNETILCTIVENTTKRLARWKSHGAADVHGQATSSSRRRTVSNSFTTRALEVLSKALQQQAAKSSAVTIRYSEFISNLALLYHRDGLNATSNLTTVLRAAKLASHEGTQWLAEPLREAPPGKRYDLLRWLLLNVSNYKIDLGARAVAPSATPEFHPLLFEILPPTDALDFLDTLLRLRLQMRIPGPMRASDDAAAINTGLLRLSIGGTALTSVTSALEHISRCQKKAQTSRDAPVRAFWVEAAFRFAALSRSPDTLNETLLWARRFNNDPLTVKQAYGMDVMSGRHMVECLSGLPDRAEADVVHTEVAQQLEKANKTLLFVLDTAIMCQKDPAFHASAWKRSLRLMIGNVVQTRVQRTHFLVRRRGWTNAAVYGTVWQDTLDTLIKAEEICLVEENAALEMHEPDGLTHPILVTDGAAKAATLRFLDELASARDQLWRTHRIKLNANTLELRDPWPQGLPVQCLKKFIYKGDIHDDDMPFLSKRLRSVVFPDPRLVLGDLPQNKEIASAIGAFVENYKCTLCEYVRGVPSLRDSRILEAWQYALLRLSDRMTPLEARLYWNGVFHDSQVDVPKSWLDLPAPKWPRIPDIDDANENMSEWNPLQEPQRPESPKRVLLAIILDAITSHFSNSVSRHQTGITIFSFSAPTVPVHQATSFWSLHEESHLPRYAEEAFIATGLLYLDSRVKSGSSLLRKPFPSGDVLRYPAVFLDESFLNERALDTNPKESWARDVLRRSLPHVPATLLARLAATLMRELQEKVGTKPITAFDVLKMLAYSDKPELAFEDIVGVITDRPDESSWHRVLLQAGIFKRLPAEQARTLVNTLTTKLTDRLEQQARRLAARTADGTMAKNATSQPPASFVKITTIKMLAELLQNVAFDESFSVDTLRSVLVGSTHLDVRAAVVSSLVQILSKTPSERIREAILTTLEKHVIPTAASMNERKPMTEQDWLEAEKLLRLPEVSAERPLQASMRMIARTLLPPTLQAAFYRRIIVPLIEVSTENNVRWTRLFLKKYDVLHWLAYVTPVPTDVMLPVEALHQANSATAAITELVTPQAFEQYSKYVLAKLAEPPNLVDFNKTLREIKTEDGAEARNHWLSQWGGASWSVIHTYEVLDVPKMLRTAEWSAKPGTLQLEHAHAHERKVIDTMLQNYDKNGAGHWSTKLVRHELRPTDGYQAAKKWALHVKPLLEYMVRRVDEMRTPEWERDPQRIPSILPSTFLIRIRLLSHPGDGITGGVAEMVTRSHAFADEVIVLLAELAEQRTYHVHFKLLQEHVKRWVVPRTLVAVTMRIGSSIFPLEGLATTAQLLRVEMTRHLLEGSKRPEDGLQAGAVRNTLLLWRQSSDEEIRQYGISAMRQLERDWKWMDSW
ncbi:hypothetical protein LTR95_007267 [Oleoguttula sp. CCFEE 5521]